MTTQSTQPLPPRGGNKAVKKSKPKKRGKTVLKYVLIIFILLLLSAGAYAGYLWYKANQVLDDITVNNAKDATEEEMASVKPMTILLLGLDSREGLGLMNTDVIMALTMNPETKSATLVSIPRDTYIHPSGYSEGWKANAFYSIAKNNGYGEGEFGEVKTIFSEFLDIEMDYAVLINFEAFKDVVDALDGVYVEVDQDMRYVDTVDGTDINLKAGWQTLDGQDALDFVRYRKSNRGTGASSDQERNQRQQQVLSAIIDKIKSPTVVLSAGGLLDAVGDNVKTDLPKNQIIDIIQTYAGISSNNIEYIPLEGRWVSPYIELDPVKFEEAKQKLKQRLQADEAQTVIPEETGTDAESESANGQ
ncbi:LCP family protein [Marinicrinis lubricantis]|uniref:LCP family protein n=1 Tax=Marinicrinis lubricantis TaxID=2086470 RepID=A0ABW1IUT1_9BACL